MPEEAQKKEERAPKEGVTFGAISWLEIKDYFNYYMPGLIWLINVVVVWWIVDRNGQERAASALGQMREAILLPLIILFPFLLGVSLAGSGNLVHSITDFVFGRPERYVVGGKRIKWFGLISRICDNFKASKKWNVWREVAAIGIIPLGLGRTVLGCRMQKSITEMLDAISKSSGFGIDSQFSILRISQYEGYPQWVKDKSLRLDNLMNLHEGLIAPVVVLLVVVQVMGRKGMLAQDGTAILSFGLFALLVSLIWRYQLFRELRAMHVYRCFYLFRKPLELTALGLSLSKAI